MLRLPPLVVYTCSSTATLYRASRLSNIEVPRFNRESHGPVTLHSPWMKVWGRSAKDTASIEKTSDKRDVI